MLGDAVKDLVDGVGATATAQDGVGLSLVGPGVHVRPRARAGSGSETSHTLSDSPNDNGGTPGETKGMKRKRAREDDAGKGDGGGDGDGDPMDIDVESQQSPDSCLLAFVRVLECLYTLVMSANSALGADEVASSHLRHALRGEPEAVALIMSRSLQLATTATIRLSQQMAVDNLQHLLHVFPAAMELWELRSSRRDDTENKPSNVRCTEGSCGMYRANSSSQDCFASHCFLYALKLQVCLRSINNTHESSQVIYGVERLIALHVVLPLRAAFFDRGGSGIDYSADEPDWSPVQPVTEALKPLFSKDISTKKAELIPGLFDIATRSVPRDTFRRQTHEAPWLETLFVAIAELAYSIVKEESASPAYLSDFVRILERLFRIALERKVQLSLHTLLVHASYTGLLKEDPAEVEWDLTALLIKLGVDIFLPNSGLKDSGTLLNALLGKIILHWSRGAVHDSSYEVIKNGVVIPLLRGFAAARDLSTFIQIWREQLVAAEEIRSQNSSLPPFTAWEDDDLCNAYGELVQTAFTDIQRTRQMQAAASDIKTLEDGTITDSPAVYAEVVVLEAGLKGRFSNLDSANEAIRSIAVAANVTLSSEKCLHWRWRLWRLARNLLEHKLANILGDAVGNLVDAAGKSIRRLHGDAAEKPGALLECYEAYQFALIAAMDAGYSEEFNSLTEQVVAFTTSITRNGMSESPWNGRTETLASPTSLALGYFLTLLRNPPVWHHVKSETRRSLFEQVLSLAVAEFRPSRSGLGLNSAPAEARFVQVWASLVCHEYLLNAPWVVNELVMVLSDKVKTGAPGRELYIESLQRIPATLISRRQRGILLDLLLDVLLQGNGVEVTIGILSMMAKLADMPKAAAAVINDWEPTWKAAKAISLQGSEVDQQLTKAFRNLHHAVIGKLVVLSEGERCRLFKKLYRVVSSRSSSEIVDINSAESFFLRISLSQLWVHRSELAGAVDEAELAACRQRVFDSVVAEVKSVKDRCRKDKLQGTTILVKTLDLLEDFEDLAVGNSGLEKHLSKIESYIDGSDRSSDPSSRRLIRRRILACRDPRKSITSPVLQCAETLSLDKPYGQEQHLFIRTTMDRFRSMTVENLVQVIRELREEGQDNLADEEKTHNLLVVSLAASSLPPVDDKDSPAAKELSALCTVVTTSLHRCSSIEHFSLATECLDTCLLRYHTRAVSQWNIDSLLAEVSICASLAGPQINPLYAPTVFTRLCRLTGSLFALHRQHLGGRFHLILPVLQRLLNCLFLFPGHSTKRHGHLRSATEHNLPPWLPSSSSSSSSPPLQPAHAVHYTRLLTSLCDPTVSAVSSSSSSASASSSSLPTPGHEGLTDQTKKAKRIAGQFLQFLVMEYAQCSLRGFLKPDVKAALLPGLYVVLDVISRDAMRALNAGLDGSGRAVFRGLFEDYSRFGRWNKG